MPEPFDLPTCLRSAGIVEPPVAYPRDSVIVSQGEACNYVFYVLEGRVQLSATSSGGREAIFGMLGPGHFFGEGGLTGQRLYTATATATTQCGVMRVAKAQMLHVLHTQHAVSDRFIAHLLARNIRVEEDLVDQMFNSAEKRLARALLLLARYDTSEPAVFDDAPRTIAPITQEALADIIGSTRSRVNVFMKKFERLNLIDCTDGVKVKQALSTFLLSD